MGENSNTVDHDAHVPVAGVPGTSLGEMREAFRGPELNFRPGPRAGLTATQAAEGVTVYEATAHGVRYQVEGYIIDTMAARPRRAFRAYRMAGPRATDRVPAADGGEHRTRAAAYAQAEQDLAAVLADRASQATEERASVEVAATPRVNDRVEVVEGPLRGARGKVIGTRLHGEAARISVMLDGEHGKSRRFIGERMLRVINGVDEQAPAEASAREVTATTAAWRAEMTEAPPVKMPAWGAIQSFLGIRIGDAVTVDTMTDGRVWHVVRFWRQGGAVWASLAIGAGRTQAPAYRLTKFDPSRDIDAEHAADLRTIKHLNLGDLRKGHDNALRRIIARAKYDALREVLAQLDGWIESQKANHEALSHRGEIEGCWNLWRPDDIRQMVNDAARATGTREPWGGAR